VHEPRAGLWFAGVYKHGVFASADGGRTWEPRTTGLAEPSVFSLTVATLPDGAVRLYCGTEPARLFFSDDLGQGWTELVGLQDAPSKPTWRFAAEPFAAHLKQISVAPGQPLTLYASVEVGGLHKSADGGATFAELDVPHLDVHRTVLDPRDPQRLYLIGGAGVFLSPDGGATWQPLLAKQNPIGVYPDFLLYAPSDPDRLFLSASEHGPRSWLQEHRVAGGQMARSHDSGQTWEPCMRGLPAERFHGSIEAACLEEAGGVLSVFTADTDGTVAWTRDGGDSWEIIAQTAPVSKSVHAELMRGGGPTPLKFGNGQLVINGVPV
jgi:photosystem II stability/assembly factor-like uncharacterized protein